MTSVSCPAAHCKEGPALPKGSSTEGRVPKSLLRDMNSHLPAAVHFPLLNYPYIFIVKVKKKDIMVSHEQIAEFKHFLFMEPLQTAGCLAWALQTAHCWGCATPHWGAHSHQGVCLAQWCSMAFPEEHLWSNGIWIKVGLGHLAGMLSLFSSAIMQEALAQRSIQKLADVKQCLSGNIPVWVLMTQWNKTLLWNVTLHEK